MRRKPVVWYVDDLPSNLEKFKSNHSHIFEVRTFRTPSALLEAFGDERPDAVLCDIFFYGNLSEAESMERVVQERAREIRRFGQEIGANQLANQSGIELIQQISRRFRKEFPIYAYTSKGPFLLDESGFDRVGESGARWLFKGKYGPATEQMIITQDIEEFHLRNSFTIRVARIFWVALFGSGILGGLVVWFLTEKLPTLMR